MTRRYKGATLSANAATTTGGESGVAAGSWTLAQQSQAQSSGTWPMQPLPKYVEDVFSTYLYTGTGAAQTITNGIDLAGKGGLVWTKNRAAGSVGTTHLLGTNQQPNILRTSDTGFNWSPVSGIYSSFNSNGYTLSGSNFSGENGVTYASWTFRKQPKFFDVVTYTGNGVAGLTVPHSLGSVPGCIIIKGTNSTLGWKVYHISTGNTTVLNLNLADAAYSGLPSYWNSTTPTNTVFSLGDDASVNASGGTYVAYLFAHNAGGFGVTGTDNVISCGSYTGNGSATTGPYINLGYEPQWLLLKSSSNAQDWYLFDTMRRLQGGVNASDTAAVLYPNGSYAEGGGNCVIDATGFRPGNVGINTSGATYIYIAIRRGPMKVPTDGTKVFKPVAVTGNGVDNRQISSGFTTDLVIGGNRSGPNGGNGAFVDRLRGAPPILYSYATDAEATGNVGVKSFAVQDGMLVGGVDAYSFNYSGQTYVDWMFQRAPGFFDEVCYTGTGNNNRDINHNLTVIPELFIVKRRSGTAGSYGSIYDEWNVGLSSQPTWDLNLLDSQAKQNGNNMWGDVSPTATTFRIGNSSINNASGNTYVAYLFATCAGVSKVGTYTGTRTTQTINCGFAGGARFVLIKRTDSAGNWFVWDTARGMVSGYSNDPSLALNTDAAERYSESVLTTATGFQLLASPEEAINTVDGNYIFLAIA